MLLFRCSSLSKLMCEPKSKAAKEAGELGETAKTFIEEMWLRDKYGYYEEASSPEMMKGLLCEQDSMELVQKVCGGEFRTAYGQRLSNDYIIGTPDIVLKDWVEDIKTSWSLKTFFNAELLPAYYAQGQGYMELTGRKKYKVIYCLVPTPASLLDGEYKRIEWRFANDFNNPDFQKAVTQFGRNNECIHDIPIEKRIKIFEFDYDGEYIKKLYSQIEKARKYYESLSL